MRPPPRDGHFWLSSTAALLLTLAVVAAIIGLHGWSTQSERSAQSIGALRTAIAVEQEGVLDSPRSTALRQREANDALTLVQATETSTAERGVITGMTAVYQLAVSDEISALLGGNVLAAGTLKSHWAIRLSRRSTPSSLDQRSRGIECGTRCDSRFRRLDRHGRRLRCHHPALRGARTPPACDDRGQVATSAALVAEARIAARHARRPSASLFDENPQAMLVTRLAGRSPRRTAT